MTENRLSALLAVAQVTHVPVPVPTRATSTDIYWMQDEGLIAEEEEEERALQVMDVPLCPRPMPLVHPH